MTETEQNRAFVKRLSVQLQHTPGGDARHDAFEDYREALELHRTIEAATSGRLTLTTAQLEAARADLLDLRRTTEAAAKPAAPKPPAVDRETEVTRRLAVLTARRNLTSAELGEVERLRTEARKLEIKRRGY